MFVLMKATTGLVLEGGGMRVVFTIGVLDYLMDADITFPYGVGVSFPMALACRPVPATACLF